MGIVGNLIGVFASPIIEGYAEYRRWQIAEQAVTSISAGVGNRVDAVMNSAGLLAGRSYVRLENGVSNWLNDSTEYIKLFAASGSFQLLSGAAKITSLAGGCFMQNSLSCSMIDMAASACSAYSALGATVLAYKLGIDFYRFWKSTSPSSTQQTPPPQAQQIQNTPAHEERKAQFQIPPEQLIAEQRPQNILADRPQVPENLDIQSQEDLDAAFRSLLQKLDTNREIRNQLHSRAEKSRKLLNEKA